MARRFPTSISLILYVTCALLAAGPVGADVLHLKDGVQLEGDVERLADDRLRIHTAGGLVEVPRARVVRHVVGDGPRTRLLAAKAKLAATDVRGRYALALEADAAGQPDLHASLLREVLAAQPDHVAVRRALGYEQVDGAWLTQDEARRRSGLVLFEGAWRLPADVEGRSRGVEAPTLPKATDLARVVRLLESVAGDNEAVSHAARLALARTEPTLQQAGARQALLAKDPVVRRAACAHLESMGDESALRPLIFSGARDQDASVRARAVEAAVAFGHDDVAVPFVRALGSKNPRLAANAAEALAQIGDQRAAGYLVKRLTSHGHSTRNFVAFVNQVSYVRDYDVEIAQASNIANPDVATLMEGVILDVKVLDAAITQTWLEPLIVDAFARLVDQPLRTKAEVVAWYRANQARLPDFPPKPGQRAPRRTAKGKVVGAQ